MATRYPRSGQIGDEGVALVQSVATRAGAVYRRFENPDLGVDGTIELLTDDREPSGDLVLVQIKSGSSYIRRGRFYVDADRSHFETWARYAVPVVGLVCDPDADEARWVDISAELRNHPERIASGPYSIEAPASQAFSVAGFERFVERFRRTRERATRVDAPPNLLIREWDSADALPTRALLQPIALDYPCFDEWLTKRFHDHGTSKKVVALGDTIAAFSMWQAKDARNAKLQTFMVGPLYRGTAIGQHLLFHELRTWACNTKIDRVHVTVSSGKVELLAYFRMFGFRVEGFAPNRYERSGHTAELVLAKHFVRRIVRTPPDLEDFVDHVGKRIWGLRGSADRFGVPASDLGIPAKFCNVSVELDRSPKTVARRVSLSDSAGFLGCAYDDASLMLEFYPLRLHLAGKRYILVPIFKRWVDAMLSTSGPDTPLKLRTDNVYYCYPKVTGLARGDLVNFYEPKKDGGRGAAIGAAVVFEVRIASPEQLHSRFAPMGVYESDDILRHTNAKGDAMAIHFGLFEPFEKPVTLERIRAILRKATNVQGLTPIGREPFETIRREGLETS